MKSALLIIDVQAALCTGKWSAFDIDNVVDRINAVSGKARTAGIPVVLIQHEENDGPLQFGTEGWKLYERLVVQPEDIEIRKTGSDSFYRTELHSVLQARGISNLIICGLQSEFCVDSTVRGALALGYSITLIADGHSTLDNGVLSAAQISAHHNATLQNLGSYGPRVTATPSEQVRIEA
jgi:nicotinamidase-related amidase